MKNDLRCTLFLVLIVFSVTYFLGYQINKNVSIKREISGYIFRSENVVWPSKRIAVCWESLSQEDRVYAEQVQLIVTTEFARAGYEFYSWAACESYSKLPQYLIRIGNLYGIPSVKEFGFRNNHLRNSMNLSFRMINNEKCLQNEEVKTRCIKIDALHEFGHAIGLIHEHERRDSSCTRGNFRAGKDFGVEISKYDELSIMDYCQNRRMKDGEVPIKLSEGDLEAIEMISR